MEASLLLDFLSQILLWVLSWLLFQTVVWSLDYIYVEKQINFLPCVLFASLVFHRYTAIRTQTNSGLCHINLSLKTDRNRKKIFRKWKWHCSEFCSSKDERRMLWLCLLRKVTAREVTGTLFNFLYTFQCVFSAFKHLFYVVFFNQYKIITMTCHLMSEKLLPFCGLKFSFILYGYTSRLQYRALCIWKGPINQA